jgi:hypothetical protein
MLGLFNRSPFALRGSDGAFIPVGSSTIPLRKGHRHFAGAAIKMEQAKVHSPAGWIFRVCISKKRDRLARLSQPLKCFRDIERCPSRRYSSLQRAAQGSHAVLSIVSTGPALHSSCAT